MIVLVLACAAALVVLAAVRHWHDRNTNDMGTMSRQWLAEYDASHP
jgi:hypothetical protein